jgi:hypothetical protein
MQKLTRKGSTNQFLTFGKKGALFSSSKKSVNGGSDVPPATPDESEEVESSGGFFGLGRSTESVGNNSPSIGTSSKDKVGVWGSIKKIGRKEKERAGTGEKGGDSREKDRTPSLHESVASEATTGEVDEEEDGGIEGIGAEGRVVG